MQLLREYLEHTGKNSNGHGPVLLTTHFKTEVDEHLFDFPTPVYSPEMAIATCLAEDGRVDLDRFQTQYDSLDSGGSSAVFNLTCPQHHELLPPQITNSP